MSFDTSTLYLVATMLAAMLGGMLVLFGRQENIAALKWWGAAYLLGSAAVAIWTIWGATLGPLASLALTSIGFFACGMVWNAARVFHGRKLLWPGLVLGPLVWIATMMTLAPRDASIRLSMGAAIVAIYAALTASELWSERRRDMQRRWPTVAIPVLHGFVLMLPILLGVYMRPYDANFSSSIWVTVFSVELVLYAIGTVFVIFMLVSDRTVAAHKSAASTDPLTGLFNRRGFSEACARVIEREAVAGRPVTVMIFDIDHFKSINDRFGHPEGDRVLGAFASLLRRRLRQSDVIGRYGGEEFAVVLEALDEPDAVRLADRLRAEFAELEHRSAEGSAFHVTVSAGVAGLPARPSSFEAWRKAADAALYRAKQQGRDRVVGTADAAGR